MFIPTEERGGGEEPKPEAELVAHFNHALAKQRGAMHTITSSGNGLSEAASKILRYTETNKASLHQLEDELIDIAERLLRIRPCDRENPGIIQDRFTDYIIEP